MTISMVYLKYGETEPVNLHEKIRRGYTAGKYEYDIITIQEKMKKRGIWFYVVQSAGRTAT